MIYWFKQLWKPHVHEGPNFLCLDQHKAQKTPSIEALLTKDCNTTTSLIPPWCTCLVQPLDVVFNAPFKCMVDDLATSHMQEHLDDYVHGNYSTKDRRVLLTKWIGEAWEKTCADKEMVIIAFKKCGISVAIDSSEDEEININNIEDYEVESSDEDPFDQESNSETESETSISDESEIEGESAVSSCKDVDIIDLRSCNESSSDESGNESTADSYNFMPEYLITTDKTFFMMPGSCDLPEVEDIIQDSMMSITS